MANSCAIGVDIGGTNTKVGLVDLKCGEILEQVIAPTINDDADRFLSGLGASCRRLAESDKIDLDRISGIGIGVPGYVEEGVVDSTWGFLTFMEDYPLVRLVNDRLSLPCRIDNDARVTALGEQRYGAARGKRRAIALTLGTGVGFGMVVDGRFVNENPVEHMAGHVTVRDSGERCYCGRTGCLETLVSATGLVSTMEKQHPSSRRREPWSAEAIFAARDTGDALAGELIDQFLSDLAAGLDNYLFLYAPDVIVLGGGLANGLAPHLNALRDRVSAAPFKSYSVEILLSELKERSGILGSAALFAV